jgi:hypothetical protein
MPRFEPTPEAIRNGRRVMAVVAVVAVIAVALILFVPGFADAQYLGITAALGLSLVGDAVAYLGQPTTTRYRIGLAITTIGILAGFWFLVANPFPAAA